MWRKERDGWIPPLQVKTLSFPEGDMKWELHLQHFIDAKAERPIRGGIIADEMVHDLEKILNKQGHG